MLETINVRPGSMGDAVLAASRQVWLAGLGAAVVTREWAGKEAGSVFRNLVREGTAVESRAFRFVGDRLDTSFVQANALWKRARATVGTAAALVRDVLPLQAVTAQSRPAKPAKRAARKNGRTAAPARTKRTAKGRRA